MKTKHTPGPWKIETYRGPMYRIVRENSEGITPEHRSNADARLIELAPDLLVALTEAASTLKLLYKKTRNDDVPFVAHLERLIARANGEE